MSARADLLVGRWVDDELDLTKHVDVERMRADLEAELSFVRQAAFDDVQRALHYVDPATKTLMLKVLDLLRQRATP
jgi:hypothetical protein